MEASVNLRLDDDDEEWAPYIVFNWSNWEDIAPRMKVKIDLLEDLKYVLLGMWVWGGRYE